MLDKVITLINRYNEIEEIMAQPDFASDQERMIAISREYSDLKSKLPTLNEYKDTVEGIEESKEMIAANEDPELTEMAKEELEELKKALPQLEEDVKGLLVPKDPSDHKNCIVEIRAGAGGTEAGLFANELYRMYQYYAEQNSWKIEVMNTNYSEPDALKEVVFLVKGENCYGYLKYESGVHRVQRVPKTESQGRVHTSAASVVCLPEAEEVEVHIEEKDLRVDFYRSSGPGGQSVNTTDSAVRITHIPTGVVVSCQDEKSQHKNKAKALKVLQSRVYDAEMRKKQEEDSAARTSQIGSGDRSEKIRTYNFPQGRVTDHRINLTLYKLEAVMNGDIGELTEGLAQAALQEAIKNAGL